MNTKAAETAAFVFLGMATTSVLVIYVIVVVYLSLFA